jgi:hypothetical protein
MKQKRVNNKHNGINGGFMRRTRHLMTTVIGILSVFDFAVNDIYGDISPNSNLTEGFGDNQK